MIIDTKQELDVFYEAYKNITDNSQLGLYELATPIETEIAVIGNLKGHSKGAVYIDDILQDTAFYASGVIASKTITALVEVIKYDVSSGVETKLDIADATITDNSFTHPDLADGDFVWYSYNYLSDNVFGNTDITYYKDSEVAISSNDKVWKVVPVVSDTGDVTWESIEII